MRILPILLLGALSAGPLTAQSGSTPDSAAARDSARALQSVLITGDRDDRVRPTPLQRLTLPSTVRVTATQAARTVNTVDAEDVMKYVPSLFLRKRNNGDTQATLATRTWGVSSSARSLVIADGVPLTALIANNNTIGGPRWGLVSPEEIARVDVMYGPYSAAYAGNSAGAVVEITTRQPDSLTWSVQQSVATQQHELYGTDRGFGTLQTNATVGDRFGRLSFWASANHQDSHSQPLTYVTGTTWPSGTTGGYVERNKLGVTANVLGAIGLLTTGMTSGKLKLAYDLTPGLRAAASYSVWNNDASSRAQTYLERAGVPTYAGLGGFASGTYALDQRHEAQSVSLRTDRDGDWDGEVVWSRFAMRTDRQRFPTSMTSADTTSAAGRIAQLDGTGWMTLDLRGAWHRGGTSARHVIAAGLHADRYALDNPTLATTDWRHGDAGAATSVGRGKTATNALWLQEAWRPRSGVTVTVGGRVEQWRAFDGFNKSGATEVTQPELEFTRVSPKAIVAWMPRGGWDLSLSAAKAYRFATPAELYQLVTTGATFTSPAPTLRPDDILATELRARRLFGWGSAQAVLFQDDVRDAIVSQFLPLVQGSPTLYSYLANVDHVRSRGVELTVVRGDFLFRGLELMASGTWLDARVLEIDGSATASGSPEDVKGKFLPNVPARRATVTATWQPGPRFTMSLGGRYSSKLYTTLDNADVNPNTYQGFAEWFVMDAKLSWQPSAHASWSLGVDNLLNREYFLFHPFPNRTVVLGARYSR